jgi:hypothetical protein
LILDILESRKGPLISRGLDHEEYDSRSWIDGEGLPSRDQVKEKGKHRECMWVSVRGSHEKVLSCRELVIHSFHTCTHVSMCYLLK